VPSHKRWNENRQGWIGPELLCIPPKAVNLPNGRLLDQSHEELEMDLDELEPTKSTASTAYAVGSDLSKLSVDELRALVDMLRDEVARIEKAINEKESQRSAADSFFKS